MPPPPVDGMDLRPSPSQMDRYWYALERRENVDHEFTAVHRSCVQRIYEVNRFVEKLRATGTPVTAGTIFKEYTDTLNIT